jgi:hypothetical protein
MLSTEGVSQSTPPDLSKTLRRFRETHPYQDCDLDGIHWEYIASGQGRQAVLILGGGLSMGETAFQTILRLENRFRAISPSYPPVGKGDVVGFIGM